MAQVTSPAVLLGLTLVLLYSTVCCSLLAAASIKQVQHGENAVCWSCAWRL